MNNFLYAGNYVVAEKIAKIKKKNSNETWKKSWCKSRIQVRYHGVEKKCL